MRKPLVFGLVAALVANAAAAQVNIDLDYEKVRRLFKINTLADLGVNDLAYLALADFGVKDSKLFVPAFASLKEKSVDYTQLKIKILPGKRLELTIDWSTKQDEAKSKREFFEYFLRPHSSFFGVDGCYAALTNKLLPTDLYPIVSINGFESFSAFFESAFPAESRNPTRK